MKTIIFYGAARKNGHTKQMVDLFCEHLEGEVEIIDCYREKNISPCLDCRYCWKVRGCAVKDDMQEYYKKIDAADNIVMASPMYFHCIPGPMKCIIDRLQVYWAAFLRKDHAEKPTKKGAVLMVGGAPDFKNQFEAGRMVLEGVLGDLEAVCLGNVCLPNSDHDSLQTRPDIAKEIIELAQKMNKAQ